MPNGLFTRLLLVAFLAGPSLAQSPAPTVPDQLIPPAPGKGKSTPAHAARDKAPPPDALTGGASLGRAAPPQHTPVVQPPRNGHAQKPAAAKSAPSAKPQAVPPAVPLAVPLAPAVAPGAAAALAGPPKGTATGMPLPRWVSLRSDEVNLRSGPGTRYPVEWVYRRRDLPVQIEREFEVWRLIQDQDGVKGWVHQAVLTGRRGFIVKGGEQVMRRSAGDDADPVALLMPGVVGRIRGCDIGASWCEVQVGEYRGWLKRDGMWGIEQNEAVN